MHIRWQTALPCAVLLLTLVLMVRADLACLDWSAKLSQEGSPSPARDASSHTGYALGQRHFLGTHERGETYRWIAVTQQRLASGPAASARYEADNVPLGRPLLLPRLYMGWLATISWILHLTTGDSIALSVERAALWEPVITHILAFAGVIAFMWARYGAASAGVAGVFFALFPPITGQFIPGTLTARTWALLFAAGAIALNLPRRDARSQPPRFSVTSALPAALALWLDPTLGFPAILISAAIGSGTSLTSKTKAPVLVWSLIGSAVTLAACLVDGSSWTPAAGELRYCHPLYAVAWFGLGLGLDSARHLRATGRHRARGIAGIVTAMVLFSALPYVQLTNAYPGWLYSSAALRRLTSLDESLVFGTVAGWLARSSPTEIIFVSAPALCALVAIAVAFLRNRHARGRQAAESRVPNHPSRTTAAEALALTSLLLLAFFKLRWAVVASLIALPVGAGIIASAPVIWRRVIGGGAAMFLFALLTWGNALPRSLHRPTTTAAPDSSDIEALIYRHAAHWIASHHPGRNVAALAPPALADSLIFHGGCQALLSTAWESHPGHVAASRILSAPEASEAEAVLESRGITHLLLPSWDPVLPLLIRAPDSEDKDTLHERLQRWILPLYLRPLPYRLPPTPGYLDQKLAIFKVTPTQDEALSLSRLAEYFVEMDRAEPARLVANVLAESYPDDPNAAIARAMVYAHARNQTNFDRELARVVAGATAGLSPSSWDRRVQRAIVLALGRRRDLARTEIEACATTATRDDLFDLTPLQSHRLRTLAARFHAPFPDDHLKELLGSLSAEFSRPPDLE